MPRGIYPRTDTARENIAAARRGTVTPEEVRRKLSQALTGKKRSAETRARMSAAAKLRWQTDSYRAQFTQEVMRQNGKRGWESMDESQRQRCVEPLRRLYEGPTSIEIAVRAVLETLGVPFEEQARVAWYRVDFLLEHLKLIIECDGSYWHRNRQKLDAAKDRFMARRGYRVVRLTEEEIKKSPETAVKSILGEGCGARADHHS